MQKFLAEIFPAQELPPGAQEGLPYWIFWLLLFVILLLLMFIFLRDKDMRRRLDNFFLKLKNKLIVIRLQKILNREKKKKKQFITELGKTAWNEHVPIVKDHEMIRKLREIEKTIQQLEEEKKESVSKIEVLTSEMGKSLKKQDKIIAGLEAQIPPVKEDSDLQTDKNKRLENQISAQQDEMSELSKKITKARKESLNIDKNSDISEESRHALIEKMDMDIKDWQDRKLQLSQSFHNLNARKQDMEDQIKQKQEEIGKLRDQMKAAKDKKKEEEKKFSDEIKEWEKNKDKTMDKIEKISEQKEPLWHKLGHFINDERIENKKLSLYYSKIDRTDKRRYELENQIEKLSHPDAQEKTDDSKKNGAS
jgi:chromosome segregation ATPase